MEQGHDRYAFSAANYFFERDSGRAIRLYEFKGFEAAVIQSRVKGKALRTLLEHPMDGEGYSFTTRSCKWYQER